MANAKALEDPYKVLSADETVRIATKPAKALVDSMLVKTGVISPSDADYHENECLIAAWKLGPKYDPNRRSRRKGVRCTYLSYLKFVMRAYILDFLFERQRRRERKHGAEPVMVSLDADPDKLDRIEAEAIRALMDAGTTADHDELLRRLEMEDVVGMLKEPFRTAARLRYLENLTQHEMAVRMGVSDATVTHQFGTKLERMVMELVARNRT